MIKPFLFVVWFLFHPVHVTLTSVDYVPQKDSFAVFVRMYFDDFLKDCSLNGNEIMIKDFSVDNHASLAAVEKYLAEMVVLKVNEKQLSGKLQSMKLADNELSMNLDYKAMKKPKVLTVKNLIMTALYNDQSNMVIVKINDFEEGIKLTNSLTEKTFTIK
jgi:hypothetical protein